MWREEIEKRNDRDVLCFLPWSHIFGQVHLCQLTVISFVLMFTQTVELHGVIGIGERMAIAPNRDELLSSCDIIKPTQMSGVPILMNKVICPLIFLLRSASIILTPLF
jgi:long-subunit acyl-CoA synthetase (AMP-forming)